MSRSLHARFRLDDRAPEPRTVEVEVEGSAPAVLTDPHGDLPGRWRLVGEADGSPVYERIADDAGADARGRDGDRTVLLDDLSADAGAGSLFVDPAELRAQRSAGHQEQPGR